MSKPVPYKGTEPYIFISYAHKDSDRVWPIIEQMQRDGYRVWYDEGIDPGTEWDEFIAEHIQGCDYFIAFLSPNYMASDNCKDELNFVRDLNKGRLLIYLEDVSLPAGMQMRLGRLQAIHWYTYVNRGEAFEKLYSSDGLDGLKGDHPTTTSHPAPEPTKEQLRAMEQESILARARWCMGQNNYDGAIDILLPIAEHCPEAQYLLAVSYGHPQYCFATRKVTRPPLYALKIRWLKAAVESNYPQALYMLGEEYAKFYGKKVHPEAKDLLERALAGGVKEAGDTLAFWNEQKQRFIFKKRGFFF